ncbi:hypothetical protein [Pseudoxanthomonas japonensis]|uniref:virion core protein, T7 gp14 family n=1 Tax=Pseudoxanthomonas japonensis TaxID=69284 RepID=UPI00374A4837
MAWAQIWQGVFQAVGKLVEGRQQANQMRDAANVEQWNIDQQKLNSQRVGQQTSAREEQLRRNFRQSLGAQRAAMAQSGTGFGGTNAALIQQSTANAELDALNIRYAGELERMGIENDITMRTYNKAMLRKGAKSAMRMRWFNAAAAVFGANGASSPPMGQQGAPYGQGGMYSMGNNMSSFMSMPGGSGNRPYGGFQQFSQFKGFGAGGLSGFGG